jgi:hypothetical protein
MSRLLKEHEQIPSSSSEVIQDEEPDFSINEDDIRESLQTFVKGMSEAEKKRFLAIYAKY